MERFELTTLFEKAHFIRAFENAVAAAADAGDVPGLVHLANGAEIMELAVAAQLNGPVDQVTGSHRSHGLAIAMGADPSAVAKEILGLDGGLSGGLGGTQHLMAPEVGFLTANGIVGGQVPLAAGAALSAKTNATGGIAVTFFGDGAANQGAVLETLNLAVALKLPMLFVLLNNGMAQSTAVTYATGGTGLLARARAFGLASEQVDGGDIEAATNVAERLVAWVRDTSSPAFLEAAVPRLSGHYHGDSEVYRQRSSEDDPLDRAATYLVSQGIDMDDLARLRSNQQKAAGELVAAARSAPDTSDSAFADWQTAEGHGA